MSTSLPLSPEQRALLLSSVDATSAHAEAAGATRPADALKPHLVIARLPANVDGEKLRTTLLAIADRHEALRLALRHEPGYTGLRQQVLDTASALRWQELAGSTLADIRSEPLAVDRGEVLQATLLRASNGEARLALTASPLALDRGSLLRLVSELAAAYTGAAPVAPADDELFQYSQYVEWRQDLAQDEDADALAGRQHWAQLFGPSDAAVAANATATATAPATANTASADWQSPRLPGLRAPNISAASASGTPRRQTRKVDSPLTQSLQALAEREGRSLESLLQALWWAQLSVLGAGSRFAASWQHDCRDDYEPMAHGLGVYDKLLPLALTPEPTETFSAWWQRLDAQLQQHQQWQEQCRIEAPAVQPQVGFVFDSAAVAASGWAIEHSPAPSDRFELALQVSAIEVSTTGQGLALALHHDAAAYGRSAAEALLTQYSALLAQAAEQLAMPLAALNLNPAASALQLNAPASAPASASAASKASASAPGSAALPTTATLHGETVDFGSATVLDHIARWARETPKALALVGSGAGEGSGAHDSANKSANTHGTQRLSYAELWARIEQVAHGLVARGVQPGGLVGLSLPRSADLVVALLAAWRAGAGYVPVEPEWPEARQQRVLGDAQPALVIVTAAVTASEAAATATTAAPGRVTLAQLAAEGQARASAHNPPLPSHPGLGDIAYVLYTSGSTGLPKGVVIEHRQLLNYVAGVSQLLPMAEARRWALTSTVAADLGNTALFGALFHGAALVVADAAEMQDGAAFARFLSAHEIDGLKIVPSHLDALLETETPWLPRLFVLGGEAAPQRLIERIAQLAPQCRIYNHYGPTETTVGVMVHAVDGAATPALPVLPLSQVLPNGLVRVLDASGRPVPIGGLGELHVGGAQLCRGYLNRPESRAENSPWVDDPLQPGQRLYRTGDQAWLLPPADDARGNQAGLRVRLAGRRDDQLKIRGFRVEPGEIEALLLAQPGVRQAVVLPAVVLPTAAAAAATAASPAAIELRAFIAANHADAIASLRPWLATQLPAHMQPASWLQLGSFPRLANGKVDRQALLALATAEVTSNATAAGSEAGTEPQTDLEHLLTRGMALLLQRDKIAADADFFELGGHSLLVIKLVARIRKLLKLEIAPALVFDHPTAQQLAAALREIAPDPERLDQLAQVQRQLDEMTPEQKAALKAAAG